MCKVRINCYRNIPLYEVLVLGVVRLDMLCAGVGKGCAFSGWVVVFVEWRVFGVLAGGVFGAWFCAACLSWLVFFVFCGCCGVVVCVWAVLFHQ